MLRGLVRDGTTLLLTTQYLEEADHLADRIVVIDHGKIIAEGTALGSRTRAARRASSSPCPSPRTSPRRRRCCATTCRRSTSTRPRGSSPRRPRGCATARIAAVFEHSEIELDDLGLKRPSLDDVFLHLTGHKAEDPTEQTTEERASRPPRPPHRSTGELSRPELKQTGLLHQSMAIVRRNLRHIKRQPEALTDVTIQPVMFVVLFAFVFGGSIQTEGSDYREWLLPGIMAQTMAFASFVVAIGLNTDIDKGIVDRFRSLPISRSSVLIGRSVSSLIHSSIGIVVMSVTGLAIGWRINGGLFAEAPRVWPAAARASR